MRPTKLKIHLENAHPRHKGKDKIFLNAVVYSHYKTVH